MHFFPLSLTRSPNHNYLSCYIIRGLLGLSIARHSPNHFCVHACAAFLVSLPCQGLGGKAKGENSDSDSEQPYMLTPRTEEKYQKINQEFAMMINNHDSRVSLWFVIHDSWLLLCVCVCVCE